MTKKKDVLYKEQGERLLEIRKELGLKKVEVSEESGLSIKSIFNYENGYFHPSLDYLLYLHNRHDVNLNYIFGGEKRKFRLGTRDNPPDFGNLQELIYKMLRLMDGSAYHCLSILAYAARLRKDR